MLDHVTLGVSDLARAIGSCDGALRAVGIERLHAEGASVEAFHEAALAAGGRDNGAPGLRPHCHPHCFGAFVLDPDGHDIEAVCRKPAQP